MKNAANNDRFQPKFHVKKNDTVVVITGADKGKKGRVVEVDATKSRVLVEGVNIISKHTRPTQQYPNGGIIKKEAPIHISNVMLWDAAQKTGARVTRVRKEGKTERVFKTKKVQGGKK